MVVGPGVAPAGARGGGRARGGSGQGPGVVVGPGWLRPGARGNGVWPAISCNLRRLESN